MTEITISGIEYKVGDKVTLAQHPQWYAVIEKITTYGKENEGYVSPASVDYQKPLVKVMCYDKKSKKKQLVVAACMWPYNVIGHYKPEPKRHPLTKQFRDDFLLDGRK